MTPHPGCRLWTYKLGDPHIYAKTAENQLKICHVVFPLISCPRKPTFFGVLVVFYSEVDSSSMYNIDGMSGGFNHWHPYPKPQRKHKAVVYLCFGTKLTGTQSSGMLG